MDESLDFEMAAYADAQLATSNKVINLMSTIVQLETPAWYISPPFKVLFRGDDPFHLESVADTCRLQFAERLHPILDSDSTEPPPVTLFKDLLDPQPETWGVYAVTMEKPG